MRNAPFHTLLVGQVFRFAERLCIRVEDGKAVIVERGGAGLAISVPAEAVVEVSGGDDVGVLESPLVLASLASGEAASPEGDPCQ